MSYAYAAVPPVVRRSQTYEVEVFDQIPTLKAADRVLATAAGEKRDRTELRKALQDLMVGDVDVRRLHHAAEAMLELGEEEKMTWSASRSFRNL